MPDVDLVRHSNRRIFLKSSGLGLGAMALGSLLTREGNAKTDDSSR